MVAGRLEIEMAANLARLQKDMQEAKGMIGGTMRDVERIMKTAATSIGAAFGAVIGAISFDAIVKAAHEAEKASVRLDAVIRATGNSAGFARAQLDAMADSMANATQFDDEAFRNAAGNIIRFGKVTGEQFERTLKASADLAAFMGTDLPSASDTLAKALASPAQGIERLQKTVGYLDEAQIKAIKTMAEMGDTAGAQNEILLILESRLGGVAEQMNTGYTKSIEGAKKATQEFLESLGQTSVIKGATTSFLDFVKDSFRDLKAVIEEGDWVEKALRLMAFAGGWRGVGNPTSGTITADPTAAREAAALAEAERIKKIREGIAEQDEKLTRLALERQKKAAEERFRLQVAGAEAELRAQEMFAKDYEEAWKFADQYRNQEAEAAAKERAFIAKAEADANEMFAKDYYEAWRYANEFIRSEDRKREAGLREQARVWDELSSVAGNFFADLVMNGKSAFDNLRKWVKQLLADMIALFAKRWVLQLAGVAGGATVGSDSIAGGLLNAAGTVVSGGSLLGGAFGATAAGSFAQGAAGMGTGVWATGSAGAAGVSMAGVYSALAAIPVWGWIAMAVIAIGAWIAGNKAGGPKVGGSFFSGGAVPGTDNGRFFTPDQGDEQVRSIVNATLDSYGAIAQRLGGSGTGFNFGLGFDHDPNGSAMSRVSSLVTDQQGNRIYGVSDMEMDDKEVPGALGLESGRMIIAALQASDLGPELNKFFDSIGDIASLTQEQINAILASATELKNVVDALASWDIGLTVEGLRAMAREGETLSQTLGAVGQSFQTYRQLFFTEEENRKFGMDRLKKQFEDLGLTMPETREQFRLLVEGIDKTTEEGAKLWRTLLDLAHAFADVVPAVDDVNDSVESLGETAVTTVGLIEAALSNNARPDSTLREWALGKPARAQLGDWINKTLTGGMSPLDPMQKFEEAQRQYRTILAGAQKGDIASISGLGAASDTYLKIAREIFASSGAYNQIFRDVMTQNAGVAGVPDINTRLAGALPTTGKLASSEDIAALNTSVGDLITLISKGISVKDPEATAAIEGVKTSIEKAGSTGAFSPA